MERFRSLIKNKVVLFDGAMGTLLVEKGVPETESKSIQSLKIPEEVKNIHRSYINAGSDVITTNTFDANPYKLKNQRDKLEDILKKSITIAKEAVKESGKNTLVAASVGPLGIMLRPYGIVSYEEMSEIFGKISGILLKEDPDLIIFETFSSLIEIKSAIMAVRKISDIPIVSTMTFNSDSISAMGDPLEKSLIEMYSYGSDVVGINCFLGPKDSFDIISGIVDKYKFPVIVQPNAGIPTVVNKKTFYLSNPKYFGEYANLFLRKGIRIIGSCCGTTPMHTSEMFRSVENYIPSITESGNKEEMKIPDGLKDMLGNDFIYTLEITPPKSLAFDKTIKKIRNIKDRTGIDAINVTENPLAKIRMSPSAFSKIILEKTGISPILHFTLRDRNLLAIQSDLLGAHALGIRNIFAIKGDPSIMGDFPRATTVYDIDTLELIKIVNNLNNGIDISGKKMKNRTNFTIGAAANPNSANLESEILRVRKKVESGVDFIITQPVFDVKGFIEFMKGIEEVGVPVLVGLMEIKDLRYADFLRNEVPGFKIPDEIFNEFRKSDNPDTGEKLAVKLGKELKKYAQGIYLVSSSGKTDKIVNILDRIKNESDR